MDDDFMDNFVLGAQWSRAQELLTLALLEEVSEVLHRHGFPAVRGYALAELTASLYKLQYL